MLRSFYSYQNQGVNPVVTGNFIPVVMSRPYLLGPLPKSHLNRRMLVGTWAGGNTLSFICFISFWEAFTFVLISGYNPYTHTHRVKCSPVLCIPLHTRHCYPHVHTKCGTRQPCSCFFRGMERHVVELFCLIFLLIIKLLAYLGIVRKWEPSSWSGLSLHGSWPPPHTLTVGPARWSQVPCCLLNPTHPELRCTVLCSENEEVGKGLISLNYPQDTSFLSEAQRTADEKRPIGISSVRQPSFHLPLIGPSPSYYLNSPG